jgi:hypothetical protein
MALPERLLVDTDAGDGGRLLAGEAAGDNVLEDVPGRSQVMPTSAQACFTVWQA